MKRPVAALDRIAKASKRRRHRLRENTEVDQIAMRAVFNGAEHREQCGVDRGTDPKKTVLHAAVSTRERARAVAAGTATRMDRCRRPTRAVRRRRMHRCGGL